MGSRRSGDWFGHLEKLFRDGAIGGLSDAQLLEQFVAGRDEAAEAAFRALVERHGPMVLRVCRSVLDDPHEAEDAFQVTFLVLVRKAGSIRRHDSIASWLHGSARQVASRPGPGPPAPVRESRVAEVAVGGIAAACHRGSRALADPPRRDRAAADEVPDADRALLPGRHDPRPGGLELGWPVGTVRGRLARARDLLKLRLIRRGLAVSVGIGASGAAVDAAPVALAAALVESTVQAAIGQSAATGLSCGAALRLEFVLRDMAVARFLRIVASPGAPRRRGRAARPSCSTWARQSLPQRASRPRRSCQSRVRRRPGQRTTCSLTAPLPARHHAVRGRRDDPRNRLQSRRPGAGLDRRRR